MLTEAYISDHNIHIFKTVSTVLHSVLVFHVHLLNTSLWLQSQWTFRSDIDVSSSLKIHSNSCCLLVAFCRFTILKCHFCWSDSSGFLNSCSKYKMFISAGWLALASVALRVIQTQAFPRWCIIPKNVWMTVIVLNEACGHVICQCSYMKCFGEKLHS
jgi:hypothetical protein